MRAPRNIDAELKALADKAKDLKAKRTTQLGELVTITGANVLDLETLAGALIAVAADARNAEKLEAWRHDGAAFFQRRRRKIKAVAAGNAGDLEGDLTQQPSDPQS